jgi:hypothetical protein
MAAGDPVDRARVVADAAAVRLEVDDLVAEVLTAEQAGLALGDFDQRREGAKGEVPSGSARCSSRRTRTPRRRRP